MNDFSGLSRVILSLAPGILSMSVSMILSHFFSGTGRHYHNTISSGIGLVLTLILGFTLIPQLGILGAGITASVSYFSSVCYQLIVFMKITKAQVRDFFISSDDLIFIKGEISELMKKNN
jgi:O-antigen/teichoic acid export membrane protein